ncbi:MAG TPA: hypothetical protein VMW35_20580 [Myxococcota bacterium]|jgi:DMSO/TMAO reductase YedYZ heme-binding membrane subunit|nr:hypothetical protein [Myxococcota bacterium]
MSPAESVPTASGASRSAPTIRLALAAAALACTAVAIGLALGADSAERWRLAARYTARLSFLVFVPVFAASAWHRLSPGAASRWLMRRRRSLGLSFATSHTVHLGALTMANLVAGTMPNATTLVGGGGAYGMLYLLAATSNDAAVRRLGARRWQRLHRTGVYWLWFVFTFSYAGRVAGGRLELAPLLALALAAWALRIGAWRARRARHGALPASAAADAEGRV